MRKISSLPFGVHHCSALPHVASDDWFVETDGVPTHEGPIRISATAVREAARLGGLPSEADYERMRVERDRALGEVEELRHRVTEAELFSQAIDVIESKDFRARKRPGRKPKPKVEA